MSGPQVVFRGWPCLAGGYRVSAGLSGKRRKYMFLSLTVLDFKVANQS